MNVKLLSKLLATTLLFLSACLPAHAGAMDYKYICKCVHGIDFDHELGRDEGMESLGVDIMCIKSSKHIILENRNGEAFKMGLAQGYSWADNKNIEYISLPHKQKYYVISMKMKESNS